MPKKYYLFLSFNQNSFFINEKLIENIPSTQKLIHICFLPHQLNFNIEHLRDNIKVFTYDSCWSILSFILYSIIKINQYQKIILPHYDIPIIRYFVFLTSTKYSKYFVLPDGVMFPSDFDFGSKKLKQKKQLFKNLNSCSKVFYKFINLLINRFIKSREYFYEKSYVFGFGEYFWEYYKLLHVQKGKYLCLGSPIFEEYYQSRITSTYFKKTFTVTFFLQPFVEEHWVDEIKFIETLITSIRIFKQHSIKLILKFHPSQHIEHYRKILNDQINEYFEINPQISNKHLIEKSDFILAYNTTLICDALALQKHVVIFNLFDIKRTNEYVDYLNLKVLYSKDDLIKYLNQYYNEPSIVSITDKSLVKKFLFIEKDISKQISKFIELER